MAMDISSDGLNFIKKWEAFIGYVYDDADKKHPPKAWTGAPPVGTLTIGYGHTSAAGAPKIAQGLTVTEPEAQQILHDDLRPVIAVVNAAVKVVLTQHQFDAVVSFVFNTGQLANTTLLKVINNHDFGDVPGQFMQWIRQNHQIVPGLVNRRAGEVDLWNTP